jgi:hypothetical protein
LRFTPNGGYTTFDPSFGYLFMWNTDKQNGAIASYWKGYTGIPLLKIPNEPESIKVSTMSRFDRVAFDGVMPA